MLKNLGEEEIREALQFPERVPGFLTGRIQDVYKPAETFNVIRDMSNLGKNMMSARDRSPEYQKLVNSVKKMGRLNRDDYTNPQVVQETTNAGLEVLRAVEDYTKGKKKVRSNDDGKERFNNALDALGILYQNVPGMRPEIDKVMARINKVRKAEDPKNLY